MSAPTIPGRSDVESSAERARVETALQESERRYRLLFENMGEGFALAEMIWDEGGRPIDWRYLEVNDAWAQTGVPVSQTAGRTAREVNPAIEPYWIETYGRVVQTGQSVTFEAYASGFGKWFGTTAFKHSENRFGLLFRDVTERKRAEEALRKSEAEFRTISEAAPALVWVCSAAGENIYFNERWYEYTGQTAEEAAGYGWATTMHPDDAARILPYWEFCQQTGEPYEGQVRYRRHDGAYRWHIFRGLPRRNEAGGIEAWYGLSIDTDDAKRAEQSLQVAMEALAQANERLEERVRERTRALTERSDELAEVSAMRQELLRRLVTAQEAERGRISRDLHDDTGQQLTALLLGLNNLKTQPSVAQDHEAQALLSGLQELAGEVAKKSHRLSFTLRPTALDDQGLMGALHNYVETWSTWSGLPVRVEGVGLDDGDQQRLPEEVETTIYRVAQEALTNILKYAAPGVAASSASRVEILVQRNPSGILTVIEDDGPGFDAEAVLNRPPGERRLGIFGMQERARLVGGTLEVESTPGEGTAVYLRIPASPQ